MRGFPPHKEVLFFCAFALTAAAGCGLDATQGPSPDAFAPSADDELRELSLKIRAADGGVEVSDSPALKSGADGALACGADRFDVDGRTRLSCTRASELLEVVVDHAAKSAVVIHRPSGRGVDKRSFFVCTTSGNGPSDLPSSLACKTKSPSTSGHGGLASPFASTVDGVGIPNAHAVGDGASLLRGMAPRSASDYDDLLGAGVAAVLVFKNQTGTGHDVQDEIDELSRRGLSAASVANIPFAWKDLDGFEAPCKQTLDALAFVKKQLAGGKKTFFHCTVGEDRTGYLAAMERLLTEDGMTPERAFDEEMCERGYASGNPLKPAFVVGALNAKTGLTPLYRKMAFLVAKGRLSKARLDASICAADPADDPDFDAAALPDERLRCGTSTKFAP